MLGVCTCAFIWFFWQRLVPEGQHIYIQWCDDAELSWRVITNHKQAEDSYPLLSKRCCNNWEHTLAVSQKLIIKNCNFARHFCANFKEVSSASLWAEKKKRPINIVILSSSLKICRLLVCVLQTGSLIWQDLEFNMQIIRPSLLFSSDRPSFYRGGISTVKLYSEPVVSAP